MDTWTAIGSVRVVRRFAPRPLEDAHLSRILDAGRRAGSSKNLQRWAFITVRQRERLTELAKVGPYAGHVAGAAVAVALVTPDPSGADGPLSVTWDLGRAAQNMILAAWELDIGSCPATVYDHDLCRRLLGFPADQHCEYIISFGYPADPEILRRANRPAGRRRLSEIWHDERWGAAAKGAAAGRGRSFGTEILARLEREPEIEIETTAAGRARRRTTIWVVVADGAAYVASYRGRHGRWYGELLREPRGALLVAGQRVGIRAVPAPEAADTVAAAFRTKYAGDPSMPAMLGPDVLATILRLEPAEGS